MYSVKDKVTTKWFQYVICVVLILYNGLLIWLVLDQMDVTRGGFSFRTLDFPGLVFSTVLFPLANVLLWKNRVRLLIPDFTLLIIPPLLWVVVVPGGSFTNFIYINPAMIGISSFLYILRFWRTQKGYSQTIEICKKAVVLWIVITVVCLILSVLIPVLPE